MTENPTDSLSPEQRLLLFAVSKAPEGVPTETHLQYMMYKVLKAKGDDPRTTAGYAPDSLGPYSREIDSLSAHLLESGFLIRRHDGSILVAPMERAEIEEDGTYGRMLEDKISGIVGFVCSLSFEELILHICTDDAVQNESMVKGSDVVDDVLSRRAEIAERMARSDKVSLERGAELADMDIGQFMRTVSKD